MLLAGHLINVVCEVFLGEFQLLVFWRPLLTQPNMEQL